MFIIENSNICKEKLNLIFIWWNLNIPTVRVFLKLTIGFP